MWSLFKKRPSECGASQERLEDAASALPAATELSEFFSPMPAELKAHATQCPECRSAAQDLLASRVLLRNLPSRAGLGGAGFPSRVMAAIAARKAELARAADAWMLVPSLAAKLTWASAVALLLASTWLYERPRTVPAPAPTDITGEPLNEPSPPANNDDVLVSLGERVR
jgi:hypothetical protein